MSTPRTELPDTLTDADGLEYRLVRQRELLDDGRENIALYELEPTPDHDNQFTPELGFLLGYVSMPRMLPVTR